MKKIFLLTAILAFVGSASFAQKKTMKHHRHHRHRHHVHHGKKMAPAHKM